MSLETEAEGRSSRAPVSGQGVQNVWAASVPLNSGCMAQALSRMVTGDVQASTLIQMIVNFLSIHVNVNQKNISLAHQSCAFIDIHAVLFAVSKDQEPPNCSSVEDWLKNGASEHKSSPKK